MSAQNELDTMKLNGYRGIATVAVNDGDPVIVVGRTQHSLRKFWKRFSPDHEMREDSNKQVIIISTKDLTQ